MNILMIHTESWDGRMLGCQGFHPAMANATPNIDALASRGTRFANTYCELGGLPPRPNHSGESLLPVARGDSGKQRGWALSTYCGVTTNTMSHMLVKDGYKLIVYEGYPSRLFNLADDPRELRDLAESAPEKRCELETLLNQQLDRQATLALWNDYRRHHFAQFQRQAKRGLYWDHSYSLRAKPSSDYHELMNNAFTGWNEEDERRLNDWLQDGIPQAHGRIL